MRLLGRGGEPGELAISQQLKPAHLPPLHHRLGLPSVLQPPLPQDRHELTLHLHDNTSLILLPRGLKSGVEVLRMQGA